MHARAAACRASVYATNAAFKPGNTKEAAEEMAFSAEASASSSVAHDASYASVLPAFGLSIA